LNIERRQSIQGAGTAIGELPPYFMARAARLSGQIDEEEQEIEELIHEKETHPKDLVSYCVCSFLSFPSFQSDISCILILFDVHLVFF
jgi:hypothetical protein